MCIRDRSKPDGTEEIVRVLERTVGGVNNTVRLSMSELQAVDGVAREWEHLNTVSYLEVCQQPYIHLNNMTSLKYTYVTGDYATFRVIDPHTSADFDVTLPIIALHDKALFVDWAPLISALNSSASLYGAIHSWDVSELPALSMQLIKLSMHNRTHHKEDLVHIPQLGTNTVGNVGVYKEQLDYEIIDGAIHFEPLLSGTCTVSNDLFTVDAGASHHILMDAYTNSLGVSDPEGAIEAGAITVVFEDGPSGTYKIFGYDSETNGFIIDLPMDRSIEGVSFHIPRVAAYQTGPDLYWAEVSYFDNSATVENNLSLIHISEPTRPY